MAENKTQELPFAEKVKKMLLENHNIILHGAPGTGKTYLARKIAEELKATKENGQFQMVQFHPSYDYTDFVEGLRPINKDGNIVFARKDGVFKEFCKRVVDAYNNVSKSAIKQAENNSIDITSLKKAWDSLFNEIDDNFTIAQYQKEESPRLGKDGEKIRWYVQQHGREKEFVSNQWATFDMMQKIHYKYGDAISVKDSKISLTQDQIREITSYDAPNLWAIYNNIYIRALASIQETKNNFPKETTSEEETPKYIFLIDEINRGDMSKIFGELFFAIDPGYRGTKGKIDTQYQNLIDKNGTDPFKAGFYIPENVYIIGTMNDIDRSVESMDFAMRRRFQFIEVKAEDRAKDMGLNKETDAYKRMTNLNNCIISKEIGLSQAFQIGGSYFLKEEVDESGKTVNKPIGAPEEFTNLWNYRLEGLLREYLRGYDDADSKIKILKVAFNDTTDETQKTDSTQQHEGAESAESSNEENA